MLFEQDRVMMQMALRSRIGKASLFSHTLFL